MERSQIAENPTSTSQARTWHNGRSAADVVTPSRSTQVADGLDRSLRTSGQKQVLRPAESDALDDEACGRAPAFCATGPAATTVTWPSQGLTVAGVMRNRWRHEAGVHGKTLTIGTTELWILSSPSDIVAERVGAATRIDLTRVA